MCFHILAASATSNGADALNARLQYYAVQRRAALAMSIGLGECQRQGVSFGSLYSGTCGRKQRDPSVTLRRRLPCHRKGRNPRGLYRAYCCSKFRPWRSTPNLSKRLKWPLGPSFGHPSSSWDLVGSEQMRAFRDLSWRPKEGSNDSRRPECRPRAPRVGPPGKHPECPRPLG